MTWFVVALVVAILILSPWFAADSRDGADRSSGSAPKAPVGLRRTFTTSPGWRSLATWYGRATRRLGGRRAHPAHGIPRTPGALA